MYNQRNTYYLLISIDTHNVSEDYCGQRRSCSLVTYLRTYGERRSLQAHLKKYFGSIEKLAFVPVARDEGERRRREGDYWRDPSVGDHHNKSILKRFAFREFLFLASSQA